MGLLSTLLVFIAILVFSGVSNVVRSVQAGCLIATMSALAAVANCLQRYGSLQPATFIIMICAYVFGPQIGFIVGAISALVSNFFLGQGPWTPWQMLCWGLCGVLASFLAIGQNEFRLGRFTVMAGFLGLFYGWVINLWHWAAFMYPLNIKTFLAVYASSVVFDVIHAIGNMVFSVLFGTTFYHVLKRFKKYI